jgi:hypothetical protein
MIYIYLLLGLWRSWLGGGIGKDWPMHNGLRAVQCVLLALLSMVATHPNWQVGAINAVGLLVLAVGYGHAPMLRYPLGDKRKDILLDAVGGPGGGIPRYFAYAGLRYMVPAVAWAGALWAMEAAWAGPLVGAWAIILAYFAFTMVVSHGAKLPTFTAPGDEAGNWAELVGWSAMGLALTM